MVADVILISNEGVSAAPKSYTLPPHLEFEPTAITALFDGSGASGSFLPACALYSQEGLLIARVFPPVALAAGDSAVVSYSPDLLGGAIEGGGAGASTLYKLISGASTNATSVKASGGAIVDYFLSNQNASVRYVKLYDKASAPSVGSDTPKWTLAIPGESSANLAPGVSLPFELGIAFAITAGAADSDTTAVAANEVIVNLNYV